MKYILRKLKKYFKFQPKSYELVEGLKANNSLSNDQTNMLGNLLKARKYSSSRYYGSKSKYSCTTT